MKLLYRHDIVAIRDAIQQKEIFQDRIPVQYQPQQCHVYIVAIEKSKLQATFFSYCYEKYVFFSKAPLLYLKVISNIVRESIY